ncbi:TRAP transporter substrate-binding protein DctP [Tistrella mobilis]|uniref:Periplasmic substrate-binding transport protein n=1 Tax=Tistrella mobilis (strain KA081020-065) TaxID=1110502 RepID=I3TWW7_TISMK|nr:TRAP transporter substrate-binding protein DctP [Tistrella mobilis]AFK57255.1 putative periplasmic substrate-binding transport protein [Tistrella mobilis KA081020-065]
MGFTRRTLLGAALGLGALVATVPAMAADVTLKLGWTTSDGATDPYAIAARDFAAALEAEMPGVFEVKYFPNRQLGDEKEMIEGMSFGTIDGGIITNAVIANVEPAFQLLDLPFLFANEAQAHKVLDGDVGQELMGKLRNRGIIGLGFAEGGFRHMINNTRPVAQPDDVSGVKYRVMQNPVFLEMFSSLGGNPVPMAWGETFTAVQQGTIDGLEIPVAVIQANKFAEVTKYLSLTRHTYSALGVLISKRSFEKMTKEQQEAVLRAAPKAIAAQRAQVADNTRQIIEELKAAGMTVNEISDPAAFRSKVTGVYDRFKPRIGAELMDKALAEVN